MYIFTDISWILDSFYIFLICSLEDCTSCIHLLMLLCKYCSGLRLFITACGYSFVDVQSAAPETILILLDWISVYWLDKLDFADISGCNSD